MALRSKRTLKFLCSACEEGLAKIFELVQDVNDIKQMLLNRKNVRNDVAERQRRVKNVLICNVNESSIANKSDKNRDEINTDPYSC